MKYTSIISAIALIILIAVTITPTQQHQRVGVFYTPAPNSFGLTYVRSIIYSSYWNEASLLDYSSPVADIDMMLPYAAQELVRLPGDSRDRYYYHGAVYVPGSGWVEKWSAPNGGRFAFLHMSNLWVTVPKPFLPPRTSSLSTCSKPVCSFDRGDENTAREAQILFAKFPRNVFAGYYSGGVDIGHTGWPTDPYYGNGTSGPSNAHLCLLLDQSAANWFYSIAYRPNFSASLWNSYRIKHRLPLISPYYGNSYGLAASIWIYHMNMCRGVVSKGQYFSKQAYMKQRFQRCTLFYWPQHPHWKPHIIKAIT